jgi:hypothetical protein
MKMRNYSEWAGRSIFAAAAPGVSATAATIDSSITEAYRHWLTTLTSELGTTEEAFRRLAAQWQAETEFQSSITRIAMHPAYQRIIGMGPVALPLILRDLEATQAPWFWALRAITGTDPVSEDDRGYIDRMVRAWTRWGIRQNII